MSGGGGKGGGGETQQVKVEYPKFWQRLALPVLDDLGGIYGQQADQSLHPLMQEALRGMTREARAGSPLLEGAQGAIGDVIGERGLAPQAARLASRLTTGGFVNPAMAETRRIAMGGDVGTNPYLEATFERASRPLVETLREQVNPGIDTAAASAGRLGSGMHALLRNQAGEQTGQALTDLATNIYGGAYESDQARRMAALGQLGGLGQQDVANRLSGAGLYDTGTARALQASGMAPAIDATRFADAERLLGIGQTYQSAPWAPGERYLQALSAGPSAVGQTQRASGVGANPFGQALSGALGGGALGYGLSGGLMGWTGLAGGLGGLAGLLSDERAKESIRPVGITFGGHGVYTYRYRGDPEGVTHMGVMAQEVAETQPEAVTVMPEGLLGVRYDLVE